MTNPGDAVDNELTKQLEYDGKLRALEPPLSSLDATGAPPPWKEEVERASWLAAAVCIDEGLPIPDWARPYLRKVTGRVLQITENGRTPSRQERAWALDLGAPWCRYDPPTDPVNVYLQIQSWINRSEVAGISAGVRRYIKEVLKNPEMKDETVRYWFKDGRRIVKKDPASYPMDPASYPMDDEDEIAFDQMIIKDTPPSISAVFQRWRRRSANTD